MRRGCRACPHDGVSLHRCRRRVVSRRGIAIFATVACNRVRLRTQACTNESSVVAQTITTFLQAVRQVPSPTPQPLSAGLRKPRQTRRQ